MLGQRLERLICVTAFDKDEAVSLILAHFKNEAIDATDLDFIDEMDLQYFVGIMGVDIPPHRPNRTLH